MKHWAKFPGSQAAIWDGKLVDVTEEPERWLRMVDVFGKRLGYVPVQLVTPIGPVAKQLLGRAR